MIESLYNELQLPQRTEIMGCPIDPWTMRQTVDASEWLISHDYFAHLIGVNSDKYLQMLDDAEMDALVRECEIINADGASMLIAAERLNVPIPERVAGVDLMIELCKRAASKGWRVYLLGAKDQVVEKTVEQLRADHHGINIVGYRDGYFSEDEFDAVFEQVSACAPQVVFVGITSPKKERLIERFRTLGASGIYVGVGGTFDVLSGDIPRAPEWMQKARLEWLFRMIQEPRRLFKRYVVGNTRFLALLHKEVRARRKAARG